MSEEPGESVPEASAAAARTVPPNGMRTFLHVLVNTAAANITTSYLWFALTFWVYLETGSVLATGIIGGAYMLLLAVFGMVFGTLVDRHRKHRVMVVSALFSLVAFAAAGGLYLSHSEAELLDLGAPWFWLFSGIILAGAVVENLRNIALSTTVTLLVPTERHANANGLVGTVGGLGSSGSDLAWMARGPGLGLGGAAIPDRHLMPLGRKMPCHRCAHHPQTQKCHPCHVALRAIADPVMID